MCMITLGLRRFWRVKRVSGFFLLDKPVSARDSAVVGDFLHLRWSVGDLELRLPPVAPCEGLFDQLELVPQRP
ncbi:hypothetical protein VTK73DRAFT_2778 [Phialemonium thermophilum]|uniref:Transposase n=1 Tax=Phialemonium thermophilum TaxID=223376 RepID=A0ABR3X3Q3_9PEZI